MPPKIVKLPHLKVTHVNLPGQNPTKASDDWSAVYVPAGEPTPPVVGEVERLASLWSGPETPADVGIEPDLESLWMSGLETAERTASEFDFEFSSEADLYDGPRPQSSARFRVDRPPRQEAPAFDRPPTPVVRQARIQAPKPEPSIQRPKTPMERAAEYTSQPSVYKRLMDD